MPTLAQGLKVVIRFTDPDANHPIRDLGGVAQGLQRGPAPGRQPDDALVLQHVLTVRPLHRDVLPGLQFDRVVDPLVAAADPAQSPDHERQQQHHDPGALIEFAQDDHGKDQTGRDRPQGIHRQPPTPARATPAPPVPHQTRLGEGEGQEHAQGVEIDRDIGVAAADHDHQR